MNDDEVRREIRRRTRRGFLGVAAGALAGGAGAYWLASRPQENLLAWPLRRVLEFNARIAEGFFSPSRNAPVFPISRAEMPRINGLIGMKEPIDPKQWKLEVFGGDANQAARTFTLADVQRLPKVEMTTEHKCIEGWSTIVHWTGTRLVDFLREYKLGTRSGAPIDATDRTNDLFRYVGMETPGAGYFIGMDMPSALHAQTLLCYAINGQPLESEHGAPLRLVTTVKYGIKCIKRLAVIRFADERPADYWHQNGYDWYAGL